MLGKFCQQCRAFAKSGVNTATFFDRIYIRSLYTLLDEFIRNKHLNRNYTTHVIPYRKNLP